MTLPNLQDTGPIVAQIIQNSQQQIPSPPMVDPVFQGLAWVAGILLAVLGIAKPFMGLIRQYKTDRSDNARDDADKATFDRQTKQIDKLTQDVERLITERNVWFEEATNLRARIDKLESYEKSMVRMKEKLDDKDNIIDELRIAIGDRDVRIMELMTELIKTNERLRDLEIRLAKDEGSFQKSIEQLDAGVPASSLPSVSICHDFPESQ